MTRSDYFSIFVQAAWWALVPVKDLPVMKIIYVSMT